VVSLNHILLVSDGKVQAKFSMRDVYNFHAKIFYNLGGSIYDDNFWSTLTINYFTTAQAQQKNCIHNKYLTDMML